MPDNYQFWACTHCGHAFIAGKTAPEHCGIKATWIREATEREVNRYLYGPDLDL